MRFHAGRRSPLVQIAALVLTASIVGSFVTPLLAAGQDPSTRPASPSQIKDPKDPVERWKQELADAKIRRTKGRQMETGGFLLALGGDIVAGLIAGNCRHADCAAAPVIGLTSIGLGLSMGFVGRARAQDANIEIGALLTRGPQIGSSVAIPLGVSSPIAVTVGQTTGISYRVRW
jgi:hypothetical protein